MHAPRARRAPRLATRVLGVVRVRVVASAFYHVKLTSVMSHWPLVGELWPVSGCPPTYIGTPTQIRQSNNVRTAGIDTARFYTSRHEPHGRRTDICARSLIFRRASLSTCPHPRRASALVDVVYRLSTPRRKAQPVLLDRAATCCALPRPAAPTPAAALPPDRLKAAAAGQSTRRLTRYACQEGPQRPPPTSLCPHPPRDP